MQIGAFEAKTRFSQLLDRVEGGEEVVITRHGRPVAVLKPAGAPDSVESRRWAERVRARRRAWNAHLDGLAVKDLTHGGHRY